jgi:hypothetical protein
MLHGSVRHGKFHGNCFAAGIRTIAARSCYAMLWYKNREAPLKIYARARGFVSFFFSSARAPHAREPTTGAPIRRAYVRGTQPAKCQRYGAYTLGGPCSTSGPSELGGYQGLRGFGTGLPTQ